MVKKLKYGNTNTFYICGSSGGLLIDTDYAGTLPAFYKEIKRLSIRLDDITYVLATHYHPDHIGLISELMSKGVKLILIDAQVNCVHFADEIFARDKSLHYRPISENNAEIIRCDESRAFLNRIGIDGEIVSTTSHSDDSISLVLDNGTCFVGDLEPIEYLYSYDNNEKLKRDWQIIMNCNPKAVYYGHANEKVF